MSLEILEDPELHLVTVNATSKLTDEDYKRFIPQIEEVIGRLGKIRILFDMHDFHGWDLAAAWDDLKFGAKHARDMARMAIVGEKRWQEWMTKVAAVFLKSPVRYFDHDQRDAALAWLKQ